MKNIFQNMPPLYDNYIESIIASKNKNVKKKQKEENRKESR